MNATLIASTPTKNRAPAAVVVVSVVVVVSNAP
ncbi:ilvB operon leader peptide IvbL [Klebsiella pneumoniae subsp. pneumoniae]|nr:ilvB operon leader peptide IvbL [Klebsiella pneumoniae subsp. pneumoniae]